jgi:hypothetical protein
VNVDPADGEDRTDRHVGIQGAFVDRYLRNVSARYDFDSVRVGIQPFSSDFRGFLFQDNQLGVRLFGTRDNNLYQYNLAWFRRLEKDTNSGLNDVGASIRDDDVLIANLYVQDLWVKGFTSQVTLAYNRNREDGDTHYDNNGFIQRPASLGDQRPREYDTATSATAAMVTSAGSICRRRRISPSGKSARPCSPTPTRTCSRCLRPVSCRWTSTGCGPGCRSCMRAAMMIPSTPKPTGSTRSSRIRNLPARTRATGSGWRCR